MSNHTEIICPVCKKLFKRKYGNKYCSRKCFLDYFRYCNKGRIFSKEHRDNIESTKLGSKNPMYGREHTLEAKKKMSEKIKGENNGMYGKEHSLKWRKIHSIKMCGENNPMFGKKGKEHPHYGHKHTLESRKKMSKFMKEHSLMRGKKASLYTRNKISESNKGKRVGDKSPMWIKDRELVRKHGIAYGFMKGILRNYVRGENLKHTEDILKYSCDDFIKHFEKLFQNGTPWSNHGIGKGCWHIDHIKPAKDYFLEGIYDPSIVNALGNLQPLWMEDNLKKRNKQLRMRKYRQTLEEYHVSNNKK